MSRSWKVVLLVIALLLLVTSIALPQSNPTFSMKDRETIESYYKNVVGKLAPGSLDRTPYTLGVERALVKGSHVPMQLEKELEPLPAQLESQLSKITGDYRRYVLGRHILLVSKADLVIQDIIRDVAVKHPSK